MTMVGEWEQLDLIGEGGQGTVYRARRPKRVGDRAFALTTMIGNLPYGAISTEDKRVIGDRFATSVWKYARPDETSELGALKTFKFDSDKARDGKAFARFKNEIAILRENRPGLIRLLDCDETGGWMVTEYMSGGTVEQHPERFQGEALRALKAFKSLVETVALIHQDKTVHRDIKPANVFLARTNTSFLVISESFSCPTRLSAPR